jgi:type I restriction enzyme R subunit
VNLRDANQQLDSSQELADLIAKEQELTYKKGARPEKGKNQTIAEWPTLGKQSADYVLFAGLTPIGVV